MGNEGLGYHEQPRNSNGIIRSRTTGQVRSWVIPRRVQALEKLSEELGGLEFPSLYILFEKKSKVYIGEAKNICVRLKSHISNPEDKIENWDKGFVINDGRPATQSDFNDSVVRKALELYLINLFKANKYAVVARGEKQSLNATQKHSVTSLTGEITFLLLKANFISKMLEEPGQEEIFGDELKKLVERAGKAIEKWRAYDAIIDGEKVFIRPGSQKPKGWQITSRGRKPGSFIDCLQRGHGYLLVSRNGVPLIPLVTVREVVTDEAAFDQDTIDIWVTFEEEKVFLTYKRNTIEVTQFRLLP